VRASNAAFDAALAKPTKQPVYHVIFDGIATEFVTTQHPEIDAEPFMQLPRTTSQQVVPEEGRSSIGALDFNILDKDLIITNLIKTTSMRGRKVTFRVGFLDIAAADFLTLFTGFVTNVVASPDFLQYSFNVRDVQFLASAGSLFEPALTKLTGDINPSVNTIPVESTADFPTSGYIAIEEEMMSYGGKTDTSFTSVVRAQKDTPAAEHKSGKKVTELVVLGDGGINPITLLLQILISTGTGSGGTYDVLPEEWGLGIDPSFINVAQFETQRDEQIPTLEVEFRLLGREKAGTFIPNEFFKMLGAYPLVQGDGQLAIKFFERPIPNIAIPHLNSDNIREVRSFNLNLDQTYNHLVWEFDWDPTIKAYGTSIVFENAESIAQYGKQVPRFYSSKGLRSDLFGPSFADNRKGFIFYRYATPPPIFALGCHFNQLLLEAGDQVFFSHPLPANVVTGERGYAFARMEATERRNDLDRTRTDITVQFITVNRRYKFHGPNDPDDPEGRPILGNYQEESLANRTKYGFRADDNGKVNAGQDAGYLRA